MKRYCFDDYTNYLGKLVSSKGYQKGDTFQCFLSQDFGYELVYHVKITPSQFFLKRNDLARSYFKRLGNVSYLA